MNLLFITDDKKKTCLMMAEKDGELKVFQNSENNQAAHDAVRQCIPEQIPLLMKYIEDQYDWDEEDEEES